MQSAEQISSKIAGPELLTPDRAHLGYENFLPEASFPVIRASVNGEAAGALFFLFFSALGFFFSRLLLNWLFAIGLTYLRK